jgi:hypothetical protein
VRECHLVNEKKINRFRKSVFWAGKGDGYQPKNRHFTNPILKNEEKNFLSLLLFHSNLIQQR